MDTPKEVITFGRQFLPMLSGNGFYEAMNEEQERRVDRFLKALKDNSFPEEKDKTGNEYAYLRTNGKVRVRFSYRYGKGYSAILGIEAV
jgi:hypothetical protein